MQLNKSAQLNAMELTEEELAKINQHTLKDLTADEVFVFRLTLCSNEIDRDMERFSIPALHKLADLFLGKPMLMDHANTASGQTARIYETEIVQDTEKTTTAAEPYTKVVAKAYMPRTTKHADLIQEIEAGIKKEVSVGCSIKTATCSVCGADQFSNPCRHRTGKTYDGVLCHRVLGDPNDAYEVSFVGVPAQKDAGITKQFEGEDEINTEDLTAKIKMAEAFIFIENRKED